MSSSLLAIIAQRLVRKTCSVCKKEHILNDDEQKIFQDYGISLERVFRGEGCGKCDGTGFSGRTVLGEVLIIDDELRELIFCDVPITAIRSAAVKKGMVPLKEDGLRKVAQGITSLDELLRVTG